jgi:hypothetical protein
MDTSHASAGNEPVFEVPAQPFDIQSFQESLEAEFPDIPGETLAAAACQAAQSGVPLTDEEALKASVRRIVGSPGIKLDAALSSKAAYAL